MDQIDDVNNEMITVKGESCIVVKLKEGLKESKLILTNHVSYTQHNTSITIFVYTFTQQSIYN